MLKAEGSYAEDRRENYLWIVFNTPPPVRSPQAILSTPIDDRVLNPPLKR
ncbi:MAG: hypothetical protein F6K39_17660 [Okeania sp. SIO3B3]|nr:hypothetical protein [Okeania sp. SIO3B3]